MLGRLPFLVLFYPLLLFSLSCHEAAHAWMANRFGDPTARFLGRVTLNPIRHTDFIGTFLLPVIAILTEVPLIGWGKPVPVNPLNLKDPRRDTLWISASGPVTNFLLSVVFALINWGVVRFFSYAGELVAVGSLGATIISVVYKVSEMGVILNLALAFFNLIPIYPLDGGGVIRGLLPSHLVSRFDAIARYGMLILLVLLATGGLRIIFIPVKILTNFMLPS